MRPYIWMILGAMSFATMSAFAHKAGGDIDWTGVAAIRAAIPMCLAYVMARTAGVQLVFWRPWTLWWRSTAGSVSLVLAFFALTRPNLPVANVITLTNLFPLWIAVLSWPLLGEPPPLRVWIAILVGVVGVALVQNPGFDGANGLGTTNWGAFAAFASSIFSALAMLGLNRLKGIDPRAIVFHFSFVAFVFCILAVAVSHPTVVINQLLRMRGTSVVYLGCVGFCATVGQILLTKAFTEGNPAKVGVAGLSQVCFGMVYDVTFLGRSVEPLSLLGTVLVLAPIAWIHLSSRRPVVDHSPSDDSSAAPSL